MKHKDGFVLRAVAGKQVAIAVGKRAETFKGMISLNGSAAFLWQQLDTDKTESELVCALLSAYDVDEEKAKADVSHFLAMLKGADLLEA